MKTNQIFQYNGSPITFYKDDNVMVNATEMAKPFGKLVGDWLRLKATTEFTEALSADMHIPISGLTHFAIILIINKILIKNILMVSYLYHLRLFSSIILCSASICIIAPS